LKTSFNQSVLGINSYRELEDLIMKNRYLIFVLLAAGAISASVASAQSKKSVAKEPALNCFISEFRHIGMTVHDPVERLHQAKQWLIQNVSSCSIEKLTLINGNRASWLGASDTSFFMTLIDSMIEYKAAGNPEMLAQIFNSAGKEGTASLQVTSVMQAPRTPTYDAQTYQQYPYQQQYQQQSYAQPQQQIANPQPAYPQASQGGGK
jgi:hypothetical protein